MPPNMTSGKASAPQRDQSDHFSVAAVNGSTTKYEGTALSADVDDENDNHDMDLLMGLSDSIRHPSHCRHGRKGRRPDHCMVARDDKFHQHYHNGTTITLSPSPVTVLGAYGCAVTTSVLIYWVFVSLVPVYNKFFFQTSLFPYPIATAGIQLAVVSLLLASLNALHYWMWKWRNQQRHQRWEDPPPHHNPSIPIRSWIFGPHFLWKMKWCFPIGFLFGVKYGVTNLGLHLVSAPTHLLLQSTDLVWTVLGAWLINGEIINCVELLCLIGCVTGSVVLGWQVSEDASVSAPLFAILINLISPMLLGLCIATLRLACIELMRPDNRVGGTVSSVELTSIKLMMSSSVALILACILEGGGREDHWNGGNQQHQQPWWTAFAALPATTKWGVVGGALLIAVFQANCTFLTFLTNAVTVGLCGQVKIIPQWITATLFATKLSNFKIKPTAILGALLICSSAAAFSFSNWRQWKEDRESDGTITMIEGSEDEDELEHEATPLLQGSSSRSIFESRSSGDATRHGDDPYHHPPHLYADGDQWYDASIKSTFNEILEFGPILPPHHNNVMRTPSMPLQGNITVSDPPLQSREDGEV